MIETERSGMTPPKQPEQRGLMAPAVSHRKAISPVQTTLVRERSKTVGAHNSAPVYSEAPRHAEPPGKSVFRNAEHCRLWPLAVNRPRSRQTTKVAEKKTLFPSRFFVRID
jgi:hypothetical protein